MDLVIKGWIGAYRWVVCWVLHGEVFAQIHLAHGLIVDNLACIALGKHSALADDVCTVTNAQCLADIVIGDQDTNVALNEEMNDFLNVNDGNGIDTRERLIQEHETRSRGQRAGDFNPTTFPP